TESDWRGIIPRLHRAPMNCAPNLPSFPTRIPYESLATYSVGGSKRGLFYRRGLLLASRRQVAGAKAGPGGARGLKCAEPANQSDHPESADRVQMGETRQHGADCGTESRKDEQPGRQADQRFSVSLEQHHQNAGRIAARWPCNFAGKRID